MDSAVLAQNFQEVKEKIKNSGQSSCLVAVSKTFPVEYVIQAYEVVGQRHFGENKVQELVDKSQHLESLDKFHEINWHFIGHLQSNKVKALLKVYNLKYIHSIDSLKLLKLIYKNQDLISNSISFFLQYNTSGESEKSGFTTVEELEEAVSYIQEEESKREKTLDLPPLSFTGLMTLGKIRTQNFEGDTRECFQKLRGLKEHIEEKFKIGPLQLSMGMSQDYQMALEQKSDFIRLGSSLFGKRSTSKV